jgi:hypothetical protein
MGILYIVVWMHMRTGNRNWSYYLKSLYDLLTTFYQTIPKLYSMSQRPSYKMYMRGQ